MILRPGDSGKFVYKGFRVVWRVKYNYFIIWEAFNRKKGIVMGDSKGWEIGIYNGVLTKKAVHDNIIYFINKVLKHEYVQSGVYVKRRI